LLIKMVIGGILMNMEIDLMNGNICGNTNGLR